MGSKKTWNVSREIQPEKVERTYYFPILSRSGNTSENDFVLGHTPAGLAPGQRRLASMKAKEFNRKFDEGEEMVDQLDLVKARRIAQGFDAPKKPDYRENPGSLNFMTTSPVSGST